MSENDNKETLRVLIIEDDEDDILAAKRALAKSGVTCDFETAADGEEALRFVERGQAEDGAGAFPPTLILLDLGLPGMDGVDVLRQLKADPALRGVPVVVLTGTSDDQRLRACVGLGANLCLRKPLMIVDVVYVLLGIHKYWSAGAQDAPG